MKLKLTDYGKDLVAYIIMGMIAIIWIMFFFIPREHQLFAGVISLLNIALTTLGFYIICKWL